VLAEHALDLVEQTHRDLHRVQYVCNDPTP
jgi:hypothetical protein